MASRSDTELLTEHFGYPPVSLLDEIINSVNFLAERALHSIEQGLLNAPPASLGFRPSSKSKSRRQAHHDDDEGRLEGETEEEAAARRHREEIESGTHQLETLLWASIDKNFDLFEIYVMRNILCLGRGEMEWMTLGHYRGLDVEGALAAEGAAQGEGEQPERGNSAAATVEGINLLRRQLQASQRLHTMLVAEQARNAALLGEMRRLVGHGSATGIKEEPLPTTSDSAQDQTTKPPFAFLHAKADLPSSDASTPLTTTTAFTLSQLPALRDLSTTLRGVMPALAASTTTNPDHDEEEGKKKSWRRERLEYVETVTRKHLENVRGLELGRDGEVRDGEWDGGGRVVGRGEVEGLERVVGVLGGGPGSKGEGMDES
ncbi:Mis12 protein-domain-containing protein [Staphylotrichum tortipilum]|uniref:Mis12 protein-domain-containing protein n=1 Tax=Staphylotrichum tortipilum TaxID=2831512 RepID=A0AAN6MIQ9_9PEZI|nr:Mis12 protein-domain-containing protein [Staphylotrichum longicolle]